MAHDLVGVLLSCFVVLAEFNGRGHGQVSGS